MSYAALYKIGLAIRIDGHACEIPVDLIDGFPVAFEFQDHLPALGLHLIGVFGEGLLLDLHRRRCGFQRIVIGVAGAAVRVRAFEHQRQAFAANGFAPAAGQRVALRIVQLPETGLPFFHPGLAGVGLGQLNGRENALVVIAAIGAVGTVETDGNRGFAQGARPDTGQVGGGGKQRSAGEGESGEWLEHGYRTSGCLIEESRVMGSAGESKRAGATLSKKLLTCL